MYMWKRLLEFWMAVNCHVRAGTQSQVGATRALTAESSLPPLGSVLNIEVWWLLTVNVEGPTRRKETPVTTGPSGDKPREWWSLGFWITAPTMVSPLSNSHGWCYTWLRI